MTVTSKKKKVTATTKKSSESKSTSTKKTGNSKSSSQTVKAIKVKKGEAFPSDELKKWLHGRSYWSHQDWLNLLDSMRVEGHGELVDSAEGQAKIGHFLESNRRSE